MLTASNLSKSFGGRTLFEEASLQVNRGDRIGLIGANGAGKSTLFSLILKEASPDSGVIALERNIQIGFLPQENATSGNETILELATGINPAMEEAHRLLREHPNHEDPLHHEGQALFAENEGYALEAKAKRILNGLAFRENDFNRMARTMSGGWIMRAHLARLLVLEPDLLMLDEPTNHLDLESLGWFQNYLINYSGAILAISHDREFLNVICESILQISHRKLHHYRGNFDSFLEQKAARDEQQLAAYKSQQREIVEIQRFIDRFRAKASKASQAQDRMKQLARMVRIEPPERAESTVHFRFPQPVRSGQRVARLTDVKQAYGAHVVYENLNLEVERGQRTVLVGPNGAGKSTLLKILADMLPLEAGTYEHGHNSSIGYFAQHRTEMMDLKKTVLQEVMSIPKPVAEQTARTILGSFLFRGEDVFKPVAVLSGGEKSRLALVKLLLDPPNFLLLDEPTTHLDMPSIDALISALKQYEGTLLFVSHDVYFIKASATSVLHINAGDVTPYAGDYNYYLEKSGAISEKAALVSPGNGPLLSNSQPQKLVSTAPAIPKMGLKEIKALRKAEAEKRKTANKLRRELEKEIAALESTIANLESEKNRLEAALEDPISYEKGTTFQLNRELSVTLATLERTTCRWDQLTTRLTQEYPEAFLTKEDEIVIQ
ncbi:MAG: ABC-F family ATP-binding cassette domain-containing protein [Verrucomicrobia bacterium]|jgi:ATP-binding cassette subfamily F protein 3|nr:MAG: ABC-F family ATP-binding cassette domain-containing protein [Verrucomicrobiota bacterium]MDH4470872.1 ABC-F family ATP-binding cassette domain-containing protein [Verrucomicrobiae bacterium]